jgi:hypothetical protein
MHVAEEMYGAFQRSNPVLEACSCATQSFDGAFQGH